MVLAEQLGLSKYDRTGPSLVNPTIPAVQGQELHHRELKRQVMDITMETVIESDWWMSEIFNDSMERWPCTALYLTASHSTPLHHSVHYCITLHPMHKVEPG